MCLSAIFVKTIGVVTLEYVFNICTDVGGWLSGWNIESFFQEDTTERTDPDVETVLMVDKFYSASRSYSSSS